MVSVGGLELVKGVLNVSASTLNLRACLRGGMSFRWRLAKETESEEEYVGVVGEKVYFLWQNKTEKQIKYAAYFNASKETSTNLNAEELVDKIKNELIDYFRLGENLEGINL